MSIIIVYQQMYLLLLNENIKWRIDTFVKFTPLAQPTRLQVISLSFTFHKEIFEIIYRVQHVFLLMSRASNVCWSTNDWSFE